MAKNTKNVMSKGRRAALTIVLSVVAAGIALVCIAVLVSFFEHINDFSISDVSFADGTAWLIWLGVCLAGGALIGYEYFRIGRRVLKVNKDLENSHWLTRQEIKQNAGLTVTKFSRLGDTPDGVPITAKLKGSDIDIILAKPTHTLVLGTTGSGKTTTFVDPTVEILARCKTKPSMVITDPKGELYMHHAGSLKKQGYRIWLIDLTDPFHSTRWNPFHDVWLKTDRIANAKGEFQRGKYCFDGTTYSTFKEAERELAVFVQRLTSEIYIDLQDLTYTICPVDNTHDPGWQKGARDLIFALALGFWEDVRDGYMSRTQFNLFNLFAAVSKYCVGDCEQLKEFFSLRDEFSRTRALSNTVLVSQDKTLTSYLGDVNQYLAWMADVGISALTSGNDVDFGDFDEEPTALFFKIPDHKENRHKLVTLFIMQMYKALVDKAEDNKTRKKLKDAELLRSTYFILDEFGNMPKFNNIGNIFTVGRSRKIWMLPIIQDFMQLDTKYGKETAEIIKSSSPIKIFIQASDQKTTEEFSQLCGKHKVRNISYSESKNRDVTVSTRAEERPLIYPSELRTLNDAAAGRMGEAVVIAAGRDPVRATYTPIFVAKVVYGNEDTAEEARPAIIFEESDYYYDISKRNAFAKNAKAEDDFEDFAADEASFNREGEEGDDGAAAVKAETKRLFLEIERVISSKLKRLLKQEDYTALMSLGYYDRLAMLERLIDRAVDNRNNILLFELMYVKQFLYDRSPAGALVLGQQEATYYEKR
ncbi:MAG: type IV secretory system conjugative DNA transfer family protein [Clostridiales bacterium]|jgi:type IV secretion system protein VirD4|nr:type IV secretory system conjugative DNA transfer family protein [Clostridiales bacterium]